MGAVVKINGVAEQEAVVPFGSTVSLTNGSPGTISQKWEILDYAEDLDDAGPDFATNFSTWTAAGDGTYFINQTPVFNAVTFKPDVTGAYLVRLTSVEMSGSVVQTAVVRVVDVHSGEYLAAAGETTESGSREGWKKIINGRMKRLGKRMQGCIRVANVSGSSLARGKVVRIVGTVDGHTISPASNPGGSAAAKSEKLPSVQIADNTAGDADAAEYLILDETIATNGTGWAQKFGVFEGKTDVDYTTFVAGGPVYFDNTGTQVAIAPTSGFRIQIGLLLETGSTGSIAIRSPGQNASQQYSDGSVVRYFLVDYDAGNDRNRGYIDASPGTDLSGSASLAIKTLTRLRQIMPAYGNGMRTVILIKPRAAGATYKKPDGVTDDDVDLKGLVGYTGILGRGTKDFTNSSADYIDLGFQQKLAGPGGGGVWTVSGTPTTSVFSVASGTLTAEPALIGYRIRFSSTTTTVALRGVCGMIIANTGSQITLALALGTTPVVGDIFTIETPGVVVRSVIYSGDVGAGDQSPDENGSIAAGSKYSLAIVGITCNSTATVFPMSIRGTADNVYISACTASNSAAFWTTMIKPKCSFLSLAETYIDENGTSRTSGFGFTTEGEAQIGGSIAAPMGYVWERCCAYKGTGNPSTIYHSIPAGNLGQGCYWASQALIYGTSSVPRGDLGSTREGGLVFGCEGASGITTSRLLGSLFIHQANAYVDTLDIQNAGSLPAIQIGGFGASVVLNAISGGTGNTGPSVDLGGLATNRGAYGCKAMIGVRSPMTISSSGGDIRYSGAILGSFTDLTFTNVIDNNTNEVWGSGGRIISTSHLVTNKSGVTLNQGDLVTSNGISGQVTRAQGDTAVHASGPLLVMITSSANNSLGMAVNISHGPWLNFDGAPASGVLAYISTGTAGQATSTVPAVSGTNQRRRLGYTMTVSGTKARLVGSPELLGVNADGGA